MRYAFIGLIRLYQITLSKLIPADTCRYYPSCSQYGYEAISKHGVLRGGVMAIKRVVRCNPFSAGGYDPIK